MLPVDAVEIPTATTQPGMDSCLGEDVPQPLLLTGNRKELPPVWAMYGSKRVRIVWPVGYYARFTPTLEVFDSADHFVAEAGTDMRTLKIGGGVVVCAGPGGILIFLPAKP
jgi:hypothetical protein